MDMRAAYKIVPAYFAENFGLQQWTCVGVFATHVIHERPYHALRRMMIGICCKIPQRMHRNPHK
jgi:hypothetical protein